MKPFYLYAVEDTESGKLVDHLTNPSHKFWFRKADAERALQIGLNSHYRSPRAGGKLVAKENMKLVTLKVEEVEE